MPKKVPENAEPRFPISFRAPAELKAKLEAAAAAASRSVGQELVRRLDRSFVRDELRQHMDGLLEDSMHKGEDVEKANARIAELKAQIEELKSELKRPLQITITDVLPMIEDATERAVKSALEHTPPPKSRAKTVA